MTELSPKSPERAPSTGTSDNISGSDGSLKLHYMSTTAGLGATEYVAINSVAVATTFLGLASVLALLDNTLLIVPLAACVCGAVAFWQIHSAGGTQSGRGFAVLGLILALGMAGFVVFREGTKVSGRAADEKAVVELVDQLSQKLSAQKFDDAYAMFSTRFHERVKRDQFDVLWRYVGNWEPNKFLLTSIKSNGRVDFEANPATGEELARTMCILSFSGKPTDDRVEVYFFHSKTEGWTLENIPSFFPDAQQPKPKK